MSKENKEVEIPSKEDLLNITDEDLGASSEDEQTYSDIEEQAIAAGWNPDQEAVEASGKDWVSAEVFVARQPMFDEIHKLKKALKNRDKDVAAIKQHLEMVRQKDAETSVKELKAKRREAMEIGDYDAVDDLEDQIEAVKKDAETGSSKEDTPEIPQEYIDWKAENPWYGQSGDPDLTEFADGVAQVILSKHLTADGQIADVEDFYNEISERVKKHYPEKFGKTKQTTQASAGAVESGKGKARGTQRKASKKYSINDIPEGDRQMARTLINIIGEEAYFKDYFGEQ